MCGRGCVVGRFLGRYRIETARLRGWDYGAGWYFVTVCTRERVRWFGSAVEGEIRLSGAGEIVVEELRNTGKVRPDVALDRWVVMPDHLHAIVVISGRGLTVGTTSGSETPQRDVSTGDLDGTDAARLRAGSLGSIIGQVKSVCTKRIRASGLRDFGWQARYHDRIIRNPTALRNIRTYIAQNPSKWPSPNDEPPPP